MRIKEYINESDFDCLYSILEGIRVIKNDSDIHKVSDTLYTFTVSDNKYEFVTNKEDFGDFEVYNVYFTNSGQIKRQNVYTNTDVITVFNKVITCMVYFITDKNPDIFTLSTNDPKLSKLYSSIVLRVMKQYPFNKYDYNKGVSSYTFIKKEYDET